MLLIGSTVQWWKNVLLFSTGTLNYCSIMDPWITGLDPRTAVQTGIMYHCKLSVQYWNHVPLYYWNHSILFVTKSMYIVQLYTCTCVVLQFVEGMLIYYSFFSIRFLFILSSSEIREYRDLLTARIWKNFYSVLHCVHLEYMTI